MTLESGWDRGVRLQRVLWIDRENTMESEDGGAIIGLDCEFAA